MKKDKLCTVSPLFRFFVKGGALRGYLSADNIKMAKKILGRFHFPPSKEITVDGETIYASTDIEVEECKLEHHVQIANVEEII